MNQTKKTPHDNATTATTHKYLPWVIWALGAAFFFSEYFARVSTSVMVPNLMAAFQVNAASLGSLSAFFYVTYIIMQLPVGILVDKYGPHRLLALNTLICGAGCGLFALATHLWMADAGRLLMGLGASFAFVGTLKLVSIWFPAKRFGLLAGLTQALGMLGAAVGEAPMALMVGYIGWRSTMHACMFIFITLAVLIAVFVRDRPKQLTKTTPAALKPQQHHVLANLKAIISNKHNWINALYVGLLYAPSAAFAELWGVEYLAHVQHLGKTMAATAIGFIFIGWTLGGPFAGWLSDRMGRRKPIMIASAILSLLFISSVLYLPHLSAKTVMLLLFCYGFCNTGVVMAYAVAVEINPRRIAGTAAALANMASVIVGACFQPIIGLILDYNWDGKMSVDHTRLYSTQDFHHAMLILPACLLLTIVVGFFVNETFCKSMP